MSTENDVVEDVVEVPEIVPTADDQGVDTTDWKAIAEANRELALKNQGIAKRYKTKADKAKETPPAPIEKKNEPPASKEQKSDELDYGQKAYLKSFDIKGADELALVKNWIKRTGDELDVVVEDDIFQAKLTALREARASAEAVPKGTKRSGQAQGNGIDYWSEKYNSGTELNDIPDEFQLKVLNAKIAKEKSAGSNFSATPIVK